MELVVNTEGKFHHIEDMTGFWRGQLSVFKQSSVVEKRVPKRDILHVINCFFLELCFCDNGV